MSRWPTCVRSGGGDPGKRRIRGERGDGRPSSRQAVHALSETATGLGELTGLIHAAGVSPSQASPSTILKVDLYGAEVNGSGDGGSNGTRNVGPHPIARA